MTTSPKIALAEADRHLLVRALRALRVEQLQERDVALSRKHQALASVHNATQRDCQDMIGRLQGLADADERMISPSALCIGDRLHWSHVEVLSAPVVSVIVRAENGEIEVRQWDADGMIPAPIRTTAAALKGGE